MRWSETTSCFSQRPFAAVMMRKKGNNPGTYKYPDFLMHYGIKGQQWGIRRYQNEDGSLTEEGKLRYNEGKPESEEWQKSEAEHLTDNELRRRNNRLLQERQYKDLTTSQAERERAQRRKDIINKVLVGTAVSLAAVAMRGHYKKAASFIGTFGKRAIASLRTKLKMGNVVGKSAAKYGKIGMDPIWYEGRYVRGNYASSRIRPSSHIEGLFTDAGPRIYNYRPRINNSLPRSRRWPKL